MADALFATVTNVDFDTEKIAEALLAGWPPKIPRELPAGYRRTAEELGREYKFTPAAAGAGRRGAAKLGELLLYGLKGMAAYYAPCAAARLLPTRKCDAFLVQGARGRWRNRVRRRKNWSALILECGSAELCWRCSC